MKKYITICSMFFFLLSSARSQVSFVVMGGASPGSSPSSAGLIVNRQAPREEFVFNMISVKPQYFGGIKVHIPMSTPFFTETGLAYTQRSSMYSLEYTYKELHEQPNQTMSETEDMLLCPVSVGVRIGIIEVTSGLMAVVSLAKNTELNHLPGFAADPNRIRMGWSTGVRLNLFSSALGIEYLGSLNRVGHGMSVNHQSLELMNVPGQFIVTLQYQL